MMRALGIIAIASAMACSPQTATIAPKADAGIDHASGPPIDAGSVDGSADLATWSPFSWTPDGKGLWIWYFDYTGMTADELAAEAQRLGVSYVLIKSGQDANFWTSRYTADAVASFTSIGIKVFAWAYVTPANVPGTITAVAQAAAIPGTSGIVLDAEVEFEGSHADDAQQLCDGIRAAVPHVWLGYTSFGWVGYHGTFPYSTFDTHCGDAFFPQVYWTDRGVSQSFGYTQAKQMIVDAGLTAPVWMVQSNDDTPSGNAPATSDLNAWFDTAGAFTSLWEQPAANLASKQSQLSSLHWSN